MELTPAMSAGSATSNQVWQFAAYFAASQASVPQWCTIQSALSIDGARGQELRMKEWRRAWKLKRIQAMNPEWEDLYPSLL